MNNTIRTKTPYEIRFDLLELATSILMAQHLADASAKVQGTAEHLLPQTAPTSEEVIAEAEKLNTFVSKSNPNA